MFFIFLSYFKHFLTANNRMACFIDNLSTYTVQCRIDGRTYANKKNRVTYLIFAKILTTQLLFIILIQKVGEKKQLFRDIVPVDLFSLYQSIHLSLFLSLSFSSVHPYANRLKRTVLLLRGYYVHHSRRSSPVY